MKLLRNDLILLGVILLVGISSLIWVNTRTRAAGEYALVMQDGNEIARLPLYKDTVYVVEDGDNRNEICVEDGSVYMRSANCPDRICVSHSHISSSGESIICLPHRIVVEIVGKEADIDAVTQ